MASSRGYNCQFLGFFFISCWVFSLGPGFDDIAVDLQLTEIDSKNFNQFSFGVISLICSDLQLNICPRL